MRCDFVVTLPMRRTSKCFFSRLHLSQHWGRPFMFFVAIHNSCELSILVSIPNESISGASAVNRLSGRRLYAVLLGGLTHHSALL